MDQISQIVKNLENRGESKDEIVQYLMYIIGGLHKVAPAIVSEYLSITLHNQSKGQHE